MDYRVENGRTYHRYKDGSEYCEARGTVLRREI